jgi:hypothetical protein
LGDIESCFKLKQLINPVIIDSLKILDQQQFRETLKLFANWTHSIDQLEQIFQEFQENPEDFSLCGFLETTTILEYALGNVYQTCTKNRPPHLLKDILNELSSCPYFQGNQIFLLQILLGTPKSSNLRNVTWHGFLESLEPAYLAFLFVTIASFGKQLQNQTIIARYRGVLNLQLDISWLPNRHEDILKIIPCNKRAWTQVLNFKREKKFSHAIHLLLSQTESVLRYVYCKVNKDEENAVRAQLNKYYVIMDSIFYDYILSSHMTPLVIGKITKIQEMLIRKTHERNKMLEFIPRPIYLIFYDLFYAADGPRLRDKMSHGEVTVGDENAEEIFNALLNFTAMVVHFYHTRSLPHAFNYESKFMNILKFVKKFDATNEAITILFSNMEIPKTLTKEECSFIPSTISEDADEIKIYYRPQIESQVIKLMLTVLYNFHDSIEIFKSSLSELFHQYQEKTLGSSRRVMVENLIKFLPNFSNGFQKIMLVLKTIFAVLQGFDDKFYNERWNQKIIRILKHTLQITQVYKKHFFTNNRNFFVANTRTCEFLQLTIDCIQIEITSQ